MIMKNCIAALAVMLLCFTANAEWQAKQDPSKGKWGYFDTNTGKWVRKPSYDEALPFKNCWGIVRKGNKWGAIDEKGNEYVQTDFLNVYRIGYTLFAEVADGKSWVVCTPHSMRDIDQSTDVMIYASSNDQNVFMYKDPTSGMGKPERGYLMFFKDGMLDRETYLYNNGNRLYVMHAEDPSDPFYLRGEVKWVLYKSTREAYHVLNDTVPGRPGERVAKNSDGKLGIYQFTDDKVTETIKTDTLIVTIPNKEILFSKDNKWGRLSSEKNLPCTLPGDSNDECPLQRVDNLFLYKYAGKTGILDKDWNTVLPCEYDSIKVDRLFSLYKGGKKGLYVASTGFLVKPGEYDDINWVYPMSGNIDALIATKGGMKGLLSTNGKVLVPFGNYTDITEGNGSNQYLSNMESYQPFYCAYGADGKFAVFNMNGKLIVPMGAYDSIERFYSKLLVMKKNGKVGAISFSGKRIAPVIYDQYSYKRENLIMFTKENGSSFTCYVYDTRTGKLVVTRRFQDYQSRAYGLFLEKYGL